MQWESGREKEAGPRETPEGGSQMGDAPLRGTATRGGPEVVPSGLAPWGQREPPPGCPEEAIGSRLRLGALPG